MDSTSNLFPFALSTSAIFGIGMLWFSPWLFGRAYVRLSGIRPGDLSRNDKRRGLIVSGVTALIAAFLLGVITQQGNYTLAATLSAVALIWLFIMLTQLNAFVWRREPFALFLLVTTRSLAMLIGGALIYCLAN